MRTGADVSVLTQSEPAVGKKVFKHKEKPLFLRLPPAYHDALSSLSRRSRRTLTAEAMIALEEYFAKNGIDLSTNGESPAEETDD